MKPVETSFYSRILTDTDEDAAKLDAWLAVRLADKAQLAGLANEDEECPFTVTPNRLVEAVSPWDCGLEPGQIRLLSQEFVSQPDTIPYIAVLESWMEDLWLVVPYSPYGQPATDGEMETGSALLGQRVLQCWNARTAHREIVEESWVVGKLDGTTLRDARALVRHAMAGTPLPDGFSARIGPPVLSMADPRREYLVESEARYAPLTAAAQEREASLAFKERLSAAGDRIARMIRDTAMPADWDQPQAAAWGTGGVEALVAGGPVKETTHTYAVKGRSVELDRKDSPDEGVVRLVAYGADGERDTKAMDNVVVVNPESTVLGWFREGACKVPIDKWQGSKLVDSVTLEPLVLVPLDSR